MSEGGGESFRLLPLLLFNLGVETGQLMAVLVALPVLGLVRRKQDRVLPFGRIAVGAAGLFFLAQVLGA